MNPEEVRKIIREELASLLKSDRYTFEKTIQILDGRNIQAGITTGTKIGTSATQKISFWNVTPVEQQGAIASFGGGGADSDGTARSRIDTILTALRNVGIIAT